MEYVKSSRVFLKTHPEFSEKWLQQKIVDDVGILGLGEVDVKDVERRQPGAGRLDILLFEPESNTRYEVELQLGASDESHIIRTLEYWDNERRRFPQYDHVAVIVAEQITGRFLNVINLFNQAIPLIAIQLSALQVGEVLTLSATRVLDLALPAPEEDDEPGQETDRDYWLAKGSPATVELADALLEIINKQGPPMSLKYNKHYIGLQRDGVPDNFIDFRPRKKHLGWGLKLPQSEELDARLDESSMTRINYDKTWNRVRVQLQPGDIEDNRPLIVELIRMARGLPVVAEAATPSEVPG